MAVDLGKLSPPIRIAPVAAADDTEPSAEDRRVAAHVLQIVFRRRRTAGSDEQCSAQPCADCFAPHLDKVARFVAAGRPVHFVIPAFPAKSRNPRKTIGRLPDLGEQLALESIQSFCEQLSVVHPPGAVVTICSDGHVFSDVLGIRDEHVDDYGTALMRLIRAIGGGSIGLYGLRDAMPGLTWTERRSRLLAEHAETIGEIRANAHTTPALRSMLNGIHRFVTEDHRALLTDLSATQVRNRAKQTAYEVVQRSQAWSRLIDGVFPDAIRLSIHPQTCHSPKIGFHLLRTSDNWLTPWHGVVLDDGDRPVLVKRAEAEQLGARLVWRNSRPSHFVIDGTARHERLAPTTSSSEGEP